MTSSITVTTNHSKFYNMEIDILTKNDLEDFRKKLVDELLEVIRTNKTEPEKQYLRTKEVKEMLGGISNGTLQNLRIKRLLNPTKIEGVFYYKLSEVKALLNG